MGTGIIHASFEQRILIVGFGSIGQAMLPLLFRHLDIQPRQVKIVSANSAERAIAEQYGVEFTVRPLIPENHVAVLSSYLHAGDILLNLSVNVSSKALIAFCAEHDVLYMDACIEPWSGGYTDTALPPDARSNYTLREDVLALRRRYEHGPTALVTHGANPGLVSILVKQALLNMAGDSGQAVYPPREACEWAQLAQRLDIKVIHVAERDTQTSARRKERGEFVNTWSVDGFIGEGLQPAELGWGTHEKHWPAGARRHEYGCGAAIYLRRPGAATRVRSWTPLECGYHGFLITHSESISIADYLTLRDGERVLYRPTVHYAYHPCDDAVLSLHELNGKNGRSQPKQRILRDEIVSGIDELGVLLMGNRNGVYWYGSRLDIGQARRLAPYNNATSLQVVASMLGGLVWLLRNRRAGIVEPEQLDHELVLDIARPYLGDLLGIYGDWTPLSGRSPLYFEQVDESDPWQFVNFLVA